MTRRTIGFATLGILLAVGCGETGAGGVAGSGGIAGGGGIAGTGGTGISAEEADLQCRAWCDTTTGCNTTFEPQYCLLICRGDLAITCGNYTDAYQDCVTELECDDQFRDCDVHSEAQSDCVTAMLETCAACPEGTVQGDCNAKGSPCDGCWYTGGDCNATTAEGLCGYLVDSAQCTDFAGCVENDGKCPLPDP
jgi:hypothetical protein